MTDNFLRTVPDAVHGSDPCHLILGFQFLCDSLNFFHLGNDTIQPVLCLLVQITQICPELAGQNQVIILGWMALLQICKNCGATFMRRTTTKGIAVWCCRTHDKDKDACSVGRISEAGIYAAFMEMAAKLRMNLNTVLSPALSQLQELSQWEARTSSGMLEIVKEIGSIQEKSLLLNRLRERNMIPIDAFLQKNADMSARLAELKRQRRLQIEAGDESREMRKGLLELQHVLQEAEIKDTFDAQLFERIVEKVIAESSKRIWFQVAGGLLLPSDIKEKMR